MSSTAKPERACVTCKTVKPTAEYGHPQAKRCTTCVHEAENATCRWCGEHAGADYRGRPRVTCTSPECQSMQKAANRAVGHKRTRERLRRRTTKRCPACGVLKPLNQDNWHGLHEDEHGVWRTSNPYCIPCTRAEQKARYHGDERRRSEHLRRSKEQRARIMERRRNDPEFDAAWRARNQEKNRKYRRQRKLRLVTTDEPVRNIWGGPELPAAPLAAAIAAWIGRHDQDAEALIESLGTTARTVHRWRTEPGALVRMDLADHILIALDLLWFDVWDPAEHPAAAAAWDDEAVAA